MSGPTSAEEPAPERGSALEVFLAFLRLGLTSFGGPVAHIGYFREAFVVRRKWLDERAFADLVALCQFLPGPASSQVGFALGLMRAGPAGAAAAWCGFTLPSAILMTAFAFVLGCVPLWRASGSGAVSRQILGTAVIGGMLAATLIAIFVIPVTFDVVEKVSLRFRRRRRQPSPTPDEGEGEQPA